jgi:[NiFe] hydrogenase diaphorase moiety large subunit
VARNRPPFPVNTGLRHAHHSEQRETFAWAAAILAKGVKWFKGIGTEKSTGRRC